MSNTIRGVVVALTALLAASCHTGPPREGAAPALRVRQDLAPDVGIRMNTVGITDDSLQGKIAVESTNSRRTEAGTLEVYAVIRNRITAPIQVEGRALFFDEQQLESEPATAWTRMPIGPSSMATYRVSSLKQTGIAYYYIELREGR